MYRSDKVLCLIVLVLMSCMRAAESSQEGGVKSIAETRRLLLRPFTVSDTDDLFHIMSNPEVMRFSVTGPRTREQTQEYIQKLLEHYAMHGFGKWAVVHKLIGNVIGICGLQKAFVDGQDEVELGYRLAREYWDKGYMSEATRAVRDYSFKQLKLAELISCIEPENEASIRIAEKNGLTFWKEGEFLGKACRIYKISQEEFARLNAADK